VLPALSYLLIGFAPGLFWLWFFRRKDDHEPEPRSVVLRLFALGCLSTVPVLLFRPTLEGILPPEPGPTRDLLDAFVVTAAGEEAVKLLAFAAGAMFSRHLDEPLDGVIYGVAAALGFASVENVLYVFGHDDPSLVVPRAFTATLGHVAFTGIAGYALGRARFSPRAAARIGTPAAGFLLAVVLHGGYDYFLFLGDAYRFLSLLFVLPLGVVLLGMRIRRARARSGEYHPHL